MTVRVWHMLLFLLIGLVGSFFVGDVITMCYVIVGMVIFTALIVWKEHKSE